jgi:chromosome segregation ATPase
MGAYRDYITIQYAGTDNLYLPVDQLDMVAKYIGAGSLDGNVKLSKMGGAEWKKSTQRAKESAKNMAKDRQMAAKATLDAQKKITAELAKQKKEGEKAQSKFMKSMGEAAGYAEQAFGALPEVASNLENVFGSMSNKTKDIVDSISAIGGGLASMAGNIASKNYIGAFVDLTKVVGEFFKIGDKRREREIQRELKAVYQLSKEYEELQKKIEDAFTLYELQSVGKQTIDNLQKQKESYEKIIAAEEAKKKSDSDKIDEYKEKLSELDESIEETRNEIFSKATDGILDDVLSTSRAFVDAWYDAFKETGDGMKGLEDNFNEMLLNMVNG